MINDWTAVVVVVSKNHMFELMMHTPGVRNDKTFTHCIKISHKVSIIFDKSNPTQREKKKIYPLILIESLKYITHL